MLYIKQANIIQDTANISGTISLEETMVETNIKQEINKYKKFKKVDGATYRKVNQFLRKRTYITAREWALARLCTDFRTSGGAEMTYIGKHLPELVPFMEDTYTPQAVNQARNSFKKKVRKASATFFYGAMCGFFTTDELDDLLFEASEIARFLLEVEGTTLDIDDEIDIEDRITTVMRSVGEAAKTILKTRSEENDLKSPQIDGIQKIDTDNKGLEIYASKKNYVIQEKPVNLTPKTEEYCNLKDFKEDTFSNSKTINIKSSFGYENNRDLTHSKKLMR
jgi:hypothetical protein